MQRPVDITEQEGVNTRGMLEILQQTTSFPAGVRKIISEYDYLVPREFVASLCKKMNDELKGSYESDRIKEKYAVDIANYCLFLLREEQQNGVANLFVHLTREDETKIQGEWLKLSAPDLEDEKQKENEQKDERYDKLLAILRVDPNYIKNDRERIYFLLHAYYHHFFKDNWFEVVSRQLQIAEERSKEVKDYPKALLHAIKVRLCVKIDRDRHYFDQDPKALISLMKHSTLHLNLECAYMDRINLKEFDLSETDLNGTWLPRDLQGVQLRNASLDSAYSGYVFKIGKQGKDKDIDFLAHTIGGLDMEGHSSPFRGQGYTRYFIDALFHRLGEFTPLGYAAALGKIDIVKKLLNKGADLNGSDMFFRKKAFHHAFENQEYGIVKFLLQHPSAVVTEEDIKKIEDKKMDVSRINFRMAGSSFGVLLVGLGGFGTGCLMIFGSVSSKAGLVGLGLLIFQVAAVAYALFSVVVTIGAVYFLARELLKPFRYSAFENELNQLLDVHRKKLEFVPADVVDAQPKLDETPAPQLSPKSGSEMKRGPAAEVKLSEVSLIGSQNQQDVEIGREVSSERESKRIGSSM